MSIRETLFKIGSEYSHAKLEPFSGHPLAVFVRETAPENFSAALSLGDTNILTKGSAGQSKWSDVPWIALMDEVVTKGTSRGYYIVYLFSADGQSVYLCLGQGVYSINDEFKKDAKKILNQRTELIRTRIPEYKLRFQDEGIDLKGSTWLAKDYEDAPAFYKEYHIHDLPSETELVGDLREMLQLYSRLIFLGGTDLIEDNKEDEGEDLSLTEKKSFRLHQKVEGRVNTSKVKKHHGYTCQACDFDFQAAYGDLGKNYIEAHHLLPYAELAIGQLRKLDIKRDFAVLCANCHKMIHRMESSADIEGLRNLVKRYKSHV